MSGPILDLLKAEDEMPNGRNKQQSRENRAVVRRIMLEVWDPIGVRNAPEAHDEYDAYVGAVYVMLMDHGASVSDITGWLYAVATGHMGLSPDAWLEARSRETAEALVAQRPGFQAH